MAQIPKEFLIEQAAAKGVSSTELETLSIALMGESVEGIALQLGISAVAVRKRLGTVYAKFGIGGRGHGKLITLRKMLLESKISPLEVNTVLADVDKAIDTDCQSAAYSNLDRILEGINRASSNVGKTVSKSINKSRLLNAYVQIINDLLEESLRNILSVAQGKVGLSGYWRTRLVTQLLKQLSEQKVSSSGLVAPQRVHIYSVSYGDVHRWWDTAVAEEFTKQLLLISSQHPSIEMKRIFILPNEEAFQNMQRVIRRLNHLGLSSSYLIEEEIRDPTIRTTFLVYERAFSTWTNISSSGDEVGGYVSVNHNDISYYVKKFERIQLMYSNYLMQVD